MTTIRIVAANLDGLQLTLYKDNGESIVVQQGDHRIRNLVDKVFPELEACIEAGLPPVCELPEDLLLNIKESAHYAETEKQLNGAVRFFRMLKKKAKEIINHFVDDPLEPRPMVGKVPVVEPANPVPVQEASPVVVERLEEAEPTPEQKAEQAPLTKSAAAVAEIMAHAAPAGSEEFDRMTKAIPETEEEETTVVAVLDDGTIIDGIEQIDVQVKAIAAKLGSPVGMANFFRRAASVKRAHSLKDLLTFMEKGELPIADDGTVLVYKRLRRKDDYYVDCHSGKVKQKVGSHVFMDEKLVDPNRSRDCSNGLHVARRDYLSSFSGDVCVLAKLAPEDVIAVPHSDARKLRAKGYFIIAELSQEDHDNVTCNRPLKDTKLLGNAVAGNHTPVLETVEIGGHYGADLRITKVQDAEEVELQDVHAESIEHLQDTDETMHVEVDAAAVATKGLSKAAPVAIKKPVEVLVESFLTAETDGDRLARARNLVQFKKSAKKSWDKLGVAAEVAEAALALIAKADGVEAVAKTLPKEAPRNDDKVIPVKAVKPAKAAPAGGTGTPRDRIRSLLNGKMDVNTADSILKIKKAAKKGWSALGVSEAEEKTIERYRSK
jgi:hypothetical protein